MICLTFDTDWMTQESLSRFLREFPIPGTATFFAHDHFPELHSTGHEICPHPLIEDLATWKTDLREMAKRFPSAPAGVRPHSCVFSHMIGIDLHAEGYRYVSQAQNLYQTNLSPFRHPWGIWELPIYYMDNMDVWMVKNWPELKHKPFARSIIDNAVNGDALFVFDIHPLHVALNTGNHEDYGAVKAKIVSNGTSPFDLSFPGRGARVFFEELCREMTRHNVRSTSCSEALAQFARVSD